jgi:lipid-binding SYLF domain-containing protein
MGGKAVEYSATASIGLQIGAQTKTLILDVLEDDPVSKSLARDEWATRADWPAALIQIDVDSSVEPTNVTAPLSDSCSVTKI